MENDYNIGYDKNERVQLSKDLLFENYSKKSKEGKKSQQNRAKKVFITLIRSNEGYQFLESSVPEKKGKSKKKNSNFEEQNQIQTCYAQHCGKTFNDPSALRKHALTHREKQYICPYENCCKVFLDNSKLRRHLLVHTGEKPFKCEFCSKSFSLDFNLRTHKRIHTGDKPYLCNFQGCTKRFTQSSNLSAHEKTHTQSKDEQQQERRTYVRNQSKNFSQFQLPQTQQQQMPYMGKSQVQQQQPQSIMPLLTMGNSYDQSSSVMMFQNDIFSLGQDDFSQMTMATPGFPPSNKNDLRQEDPLFQRQEDMNMPNYLFMNSNDYSYQYEHF